MQKILSAAQLRAADAHTIAAEPIASIELMERAASECSRWLLRYGSDKSFYILVGPGNNGGDGLAIARQLWMAHRQVRVLLVYGEASPSPDNAMNLDRVRDTGVSISEFEEGAALEVGPNTVLVDALFGTGLERPLEGVFASAVAWIDEHLEPVVAIDTPSGLMADDNRQNDKGRIVQADTTLTFQCNKLSYLMPDHARYVGDVYTLDIGLDQAFIAQLSCDHFMVEQVDVMKQLRPRHRATHKGDHGHALLVAGTCGMAGAAILATRSCLRNGVGLVTIHVPGSNRTVLQSAAPEAMCLLDEHEKVHTNWRVPERCTAIGIGPGLGMDGRTADLLKRHIQEASCPLVLDADALNILAENKTWLEFLPANTIITPHPGEFDRLAGASRSSEERLVRAKELAMRYSLVIVLKGANTAICTPSGKVFFNPTGNAGMAKGGSGDVLTGLLTGIRAQGYSAFETCIIGVYVHGLAGDIAADRIGMDGMTAMDLVENIPAALREVRGNWVEGVGSGGSVQ